MLQIDPLHQSDFARRGDLRLTRGDVGGAVADFNRALQIGPDAEALRINRAVDYVRMHDYESALVDEDAAVAISHGNARLPKMRAHLRFPAGHFAEAADDFGNVVKAKFGKLMLSIARTRGGNGDLDEFVRSSPDLDRAHSPWPLLRFILAKLHLPKCAMRFESWRSTANSRTVG